MVISKIELVSNPGNTVCPEDVSKTICTDATESMKQRWLSSRLFAGLCITHPLTHQHFVFGPRTACDPVTVTGREGANQKRGLGRLHIPAEKILGRQRQGSIRTQITAMPKPLQIWWLFGF